MGGAPLEKRFTINVRGVSGADPGILEGVPAKVKVINKGPVTAERVDFKIIQLLHG